MHGNLAPDRGVVKQSAVSDDMRKHRGPARVFESEEEACEAIFGGKINAGDVVVIRYEGPAGGPGMREMLTPSSAWTSPLPSSRTVASLAQPRVLLSAM